MAISDFQVGEGHYALAYGKHVVAGILAGYDDSTPTAVKIKVLLGLGEWNRIVEASYDGVIIDEEDYTFHPGTLSTGAADPLQGADSRFPNSIFHNRIAYYTMTLPDGMGADERPDKMRVIAEGLKMFIYDEEGNVVDYRYSTNPADVFADVVRRNSDRLGLTFADQMDWPAYFAARERYDQTILVDDGSHTPKSIAAVNAASGSLAAGTWYYKVIALGPGTTKSAASEIRAVAAAASTRNNIGWEQVDDATGYRVYFSYNDPNDFDRYFTVSGGATTTFAHTTTSGSSSGIPPTLPTGDWAKLEAEFQCHRAFTQDQILTGDALTAIMFDAASDWVRDGSRHRILLPNRSEIAHTFTVENTTDENFIFTKVPMKERVNRVTAAFRNLDDTMKPDEQSPANDFAAQSRVGIVEEVVALGSMNNSQMRRITRWWEKYAHRMPRRLEITGQGDSAHLLVGDLVNVVDRQAGVRDEVGDSNGGILVSSLNSFTASGGVVGWSNTSTPMGSSRSLSLLQPNVPSVITFDVEDFVPKADSYLLFYVKQTQTEKESIPSREIALGISSVENPGDIRYASFRRPQSPTLVAASASNTWVGLPPQVWGAWVPVRVSLRDIEGWVEGETLNKIHLHLSRYYRALVSEIRYFEKLPRTYIVHEMETRESGEVDDQHFKLHEYYPNAYNPEDAYIEPPPPTGGDPGEPATPPTLSDLTFDDGIVTGTFVVNGGTGTIRVLRKLGEAGSYAEVASVDAEDTDFTDSPGLDGTYFYKLTQDGVTGESTELSIEIELSDGAPPSDLDGYTYEEGEGHTFWYVSLNWQNNGATGDNIVQQKLNTGSWVNRGTLSSSTNTWEGFAPGGHLVIRYRVYNTSTAGYSNELILSTWS